MNQCLKISLLSVLRRKVQKYLAVSVSVPRFSLIFSDRCNPEKKFVWTVWLLTNELFQMLDRTLKCKFLTKPDWLK